FLPTLVRSSGNARALVGAFDQQPILRPLARLALRHSHERPTAAEPFAVQLEIELAGGQTAVGVAERSPLTAIPDDDRAGAVLGLGNFALERRVLERMIFSPYREAPILRIVARFLRYRPALQNAVVLESEIVMEPLRVVPLDHELRLPAGSMLRAAGLRGAAE